MKHIDIQNRLLAQMVAGAQSRNDLAAGAGIGEIDASHALYTLVRQGLVTRTYGRFALTRVGRAIVNLQEAA